jgi:hypothetical protein
VIVRLTVFGTTEADTECLRLSTLCVPPSLSATRSPSEYVLTRSAYDCTRSMANEFPWLAWVRSLLWDDVDTKSRADEAYIGVDTPM